MKEPSIDTMDALLGAAFERALSDTSVDLVGPVLARLRRRQLVRIVVLGLVGTIAAAIAVLNALPLVASLDATLNAALADLAMPVWHPGMPALLLVAAVVVFVGWLMLEEPA